MTQNRNYGQKSKLWTKIKFVIKNGNFHKKHVYAKIFRTNYQTVYKFRVNLAPTLN